MLYGIDLRKSEMSYIQFMEYLSNLTRETPFGNILYYRKVDPSKLSKQEKKIRLKYLLKDENGRLTRDIDKERHFFQALVQVAKSKSK